VSGTIRTRVKRTVFQFKRLGGDKEKVPQSVPLTNPSSTRDSVCEASTSTSATAAAAAAGGGSSGSGNGSRSAIGADGAADDNGGDAGQCKLVNSFISHVQYC
jgi:hypothetical protein